MENSKTLQDLFLETKMSKEKLSKLSGVSHVTISKYLTTNYNGRLKDKLEKTMLDYIKETEKKNVQPVNNETKEAVEEKHNRFNPVIKDKKTFVWGDNKKDVCRGEIYYVRNYNKECSGSEQKGNRPVVIVSNNIGNRNSNIVEAVFATTKPKTNLPTHFTLEENSIGLSHDSTVICEQIVTLDKNRLTEYVGKLSEEDIKKLNRCLSISLALESNNYTTINLANRLKEKEQELEDLKLKNKIVMAEYEVYKRYFEGMINK